MVKKRGLGRGLDFLMTAQSTASEAYNEAVGDAKHESVKDGSLKKLPVEFIQRGKYQPRRDIQSETLEELANSIREQGVMQPIVVRPVAEERYEIIAGERRWRAAQLAGLDVIPALIREVGDDAAIAMALIENIQREDLNPMEEALALSRLKEEFELTHEEVAKAVGKSRTAVTNFLRLLGLQPEVRRFLEYGDIEMGHAKALLALSGEQQCLAANQVVGKGLSVRQTETLVRQLQQQVNQAQPQKPEKTTDTLRLEQDLSEKIGVPVLIDHKASGKGRLVLSYNSLDELDGILSHIK